MLRIINIIMDHHLVMEILLYVDLIFEHLVIILIIVKILIKN
jgi:hypothetical protein